MKRTIIILAIIGMFAGIANLQGQDKKYYTPKKGDWAIGVTFNPASISAGIAVQPGSGEFAGNYISDLALNPKQMFVMSKDPLAALRIKYQLSPKSAFRVAVGINGSVVNYNEYVRDDLSYALDPNTQNKVVDRATSAYNSVSIMLGNEYKYGNRAVRFVWGWDIMYSIAGGKLTYQYGNQMSEYNTIPSTMPMLNSVQDGGINDFMAVNGIAYARPVESYNQGYIHGIGLSVDMGIECFVAETLSLGLALNFTPVMFTFQPQTWTVYEGFNTNTGSVMEFNGLVSPGSNALLYGTENIGCRISLNYYFGK